MIRSLRTGVSGLKSNQTRMDVVGNNIANVNTVGFKRSRVAFNEVLGQQMLGVGRTAGGSGINPSFVGLGVSVGSVDKNWGQGALEYTGVKTDFALSGDGFFLASDGDRTMLTRAGNFTFNREGELSTSTGLKVQGWKFDQLTGEIGAGAPANIQVNFNAQAPAKLSTEASIVGNLSSGTEAGSGTTLTKAFYDDQGNAHTAVIRLTKDPNAANTWTTEITYSGDLTPPPFTPPANGSLVFKSDGSIDEANSNVGALQWNDSYSINPGQSLAFDFTGLTQNNGSTTAVVGDQDGYPSGSLSDWSIDADGVLKLNFTNGEQQKLFQLAIGQVNNANGLEQQGDNFYSTTSASGDLMVGRAGRDLRTSVVAGTVEMSNVDLATEFTDMIVAQRGYQASARIITTSDELLQETVQLKR